MCVLCVSCVYKVCCLPWLVLYGCSCRRCTVDKVCIAAAAAAGCGAGILDCMHCSASAGLQCLLCFLLVAVVCCVSFLTLAGTALDSSRYRSARCCASLAFPQPHQQLPTSSVTSVHPCRTISAIASGGILFALFSAPFWFAGYQLAGQAFAGALMHERFAVGRNKWRLAQVGLGILLIIAAELMS
jgi:hypothetical protein